MPTLFTPEFSRSRFADKKGEEAVRFQGDIGYGVMSEAAWLRLETIRQRLAAHVA